MTTYAGTSTVSTAGISGASTVAKEAINGTASGTGANAAYGIYARSEGSVGLFASSAVGAGIEATTNASNSSAIYGHCSNGGVAVNALSNTTTSSYGAIIASNNGGGNAIYANSTSSGTVLLAAATNGRAVDAYTYGAATAGLFQSFSNTTSDCAVYARCVNNGTSLIADANGAATWAARFLGAVQVTGFLTKSGGGFEIDHPQDPANKWLRHSFVESPDMKNLYDGVVTADANGEARIALPAYFEHLNADIRYQLTALGAPAPNLHVKSELSSGAFTLSGATAGQRICWQVTGIRKDAWASANRLVVEEEKKGVEAGRYRHSEAHGQGDDKSIASVIRSGAGLGSDRARP